MQKKWGFDKTYGLLLETENDKFTGKILFEDEIFDKGKILKRALKKIPFNPGKTLAIGDTKSDIPMLEGVNIAIAFNPDKALFKESKKKNWHVVLERKSVIYTDAGYCNNLENMREFISSL